MRMFWTMAICMSWMARIIEVIRLFISVMAFMGRERERGRAAGQAPASSADGEECERVPVAVDARRGRQ